MDRMEKTTQALMKKKSTLMELEVRAKKVHLVFLSIAFLSLHSALSASNVYYVNVMFISESVVSSHEGGCELIFDF
jgi:hypothetical protein